VKALDLFCGGGGASMGLKKAGFDSIVGVDIHDMPEYPFEHYMNDVFLLEPEFFKDFAFIWASPPCQAYSFGTTRARKEGKVYPNLVAKTRELLLKTGKPFVLENVIGSPLQKDLILCGEMFGLRVIRHRIFEIHGFTVPQPEHKKHKNKVWDGSAVGVWSGGKPGCFGNQEHRDYYLRVVTGGGWREKGQKAGTLTQWQDAMGIDWITDKKVLAQCVPPAYSEYIGRAFIEEQGRGK
jgi:hypothetical protein